MLPLFLRGELDVRTTQKRIVEKTSNRLDEIKCSDLPGSEVYVDTRLQIFTPDEIRSKYDWPLYIVMEVGGKVGRVIINSQTKVLNGEVLVRPINGLVLLPK